MVVFLIRHRRVVVERREHRVDVARGDQIPRIAPSTLNSTGGISTLRTRPDGASGPLCAQAFSCRRRGGGCHKRLIGSKDSGATVVVRRLDQGGT
jgi:hypothetical protein